MHMMSVCVSASRVTDRQLPLATFKSSLRAWQARFKARQALPKEVRFASQRAEYPAKSN